MQQQWPAGSMDELAVFPAAVGSSPCSPPSAASFFSAASPRPRPPVIELVSCEVPEQWLTNDDDLNLVQLAWGGLAAAGGLPAMATTTTTKSSGRGRKPGGPRPDGPTASHVEAERHRRERLNRRFCDLRAAVPTVSRMDRASLLADAVSYISQLRAHVTRLEAQAQAQQQQLAAQINDQKAALAAPAVGEEEEDEERLEVRMVGEAAALLRLATSSIMAGRDAPARLMAALRALDLPVQHACVSRVHGCPPTVVQDVVVDVPPDAGMRDEARLRAALLRRLQLCRSQANDA